MLDLYHGQIQKDDVILCNTGNPLITEASDLFRGTSNQKTSGPYASFRFELRHDRFERVARLTWGKGREEKRGVKSSSRVHYANVHVKRNQWNLVTRLFGDRNV